MGCLNLPLANDAFSSPNHTRSKHQPQEMCQFLELEFSCDDGGNRHRKRTEAIWKCGTPAGCVIDGMNWSIVGSEVDLEHIEASNFQVLHIGGNCDSCVRRIGKERVEKMIPREDMETKPTKLQQHVEAICSNASPCGEGETCTVTESLTLNLVPEKRPLRRAVCDPDTICCSGPCTRPVVISIDNHRGRFCEEHTCSARDWGCLMDAFTKSSNPQDLHYCSAHTCERFGCEKRVSHRDSLYCEKHS